MFLFRDDVKMFLWNYNIHKQYRHCTLSRRNEDIFLKEIAFLCSTFNNPYKRPSHLPQSKAINPNLNSGKVAIDAIAVTKIQKFVKADQLKELTSTVLKTMAL